eukprot:Gb_04134 [translate_table: standard]
MALLWPAASLFTILPNKRSYMPYQTIIPSAYTPLGIRTHEKGPLHSLLLHSKNAYINQFVHKSRWRLDGHSFEVFAWKGNVKPNSRPGSGRSDAGTYNLQEGDDMYAGANVEQNNGEGEPNKESDTDALGNIALAVGKSLPPEGFAVFISCIVGFLTGISVVLFNLTVSVPGTVTGFFSFSSPVF